jgi:nucleotide-binding universal stress UspA family protein
MGDRPDLPPALRRQGRLVATVLAALDNSLAANPVLVMARSLARVLGARVEAVHVLDEGSGQADDAARAAGVPLRVCSGPVVPRLVEAGNDTEVVAVVIGARGAGASDHPLGSTALAVVTSFSKPVVVVPPGAQLPPQVRRVLVPIQAASSSLVPVSLPVLGRGAIVEVIGRDVGDQAEALVAPAVRESGADVIAIGWDQTLSPIRTPVVRTALEQANVPVMLIPVRERSTVGEPAPT